MEVAWFSYICFSYIFPTTSRKRIEQLSPPRVRTSPFNICTGLKPRIPILWPPKDIQLDQKYQSCQQWWRNWRTREDKREQLNQHSFLRDQKTIARGDKAKVRPEADIIKVVDLPLVQWVAKRSVHTATSQVVTGKNTPSAHYHGGRKMAPVTPNLTAWTRRTSGGGTRTDPTGDPVLTSNGNPDRVIYRLEDCTYMGDIIPCGYTSQDECTAN